MHAIDLRLIVRCDATQPRQVGQPHQQQRSIFNELLLAGQIGQARLAFGALYRNDAPELQVG